MTRSERFAQDLRVLRAKRRHSREELSRRAEVHRTQISLIESGKRLPRADTLVRLAGALGVTPNDLLAGITFLPAVYENGSLIVSEGDE